MSSFLQDLKYSVRNLVRQPIFTVVATLSLALGIGVNTAIFSALDALMLRPVPVRDLNRTVIVYDSSPGRDDAGSTFPLFQAVQGRRDTFASVMATAGARPLSLTEGDRREQVFAEVVSADFFTMADAGPLLGRPMDADADRVTDPPSVTVLSHAFWQRRFGADPAVIGKNIELNGQSFAVLGITRPGFTGFDPEVSVDLWVPMTTWAHLVGEPARLTGGEHWFRTYAELQPGVSEEQARAVLAGLGRTEPDTKGLQARVRPARQRVVGMDVEVLAVGAGAFGAGLLILALACANVMSLLLARAAARQREMSVRMALGGSRARLIRLWLSESLVLCVMAGALGLVIASWMLDLAIAFKPPVEIGGVEGGTLPIALQLDLRVFAFTAVLSTLVAAAVGLLSGLQSARARSMGLNSDGITERRFAPGFNLRSAVIALQIALAVLLLIPCGLFVRSAMNASGMAVGFSADNVLLLPISTKQAGMKVTKPPGFDQELIERVTRLPGVEAATVMDPVPMWFGGKTAHFSDAGENEAAPRLRLGYSAIGTGYFKTMGIPVLVGRDFAGTDNATAPPVAIVSEALARKMWPGANPLGRRLKSYDGVLEVVGVAKDAKYLNLAEAAEPWVYLPIAQSESDNPALSLGVRTAGNPLQMRTAVEREVKALMPNWPIFQFRTLDEGVKLQRALPSFAATVLGIIGGLGALLAAIGIYGVMAYVVRQRTREIGIRLALGAPGAGVVRLMIAQGLRVAVAGGVLGLVIAIAASQFLRSLLFGVNAVDPLAYTAVCLLLVSVAVLACYLPARHAARVNPVEVLRRE
jgi:predicted permease